MLINYKGKFFQTKYAAELSTKNSHKFHSDMQTSYSDVTQKLYKTDIFHFIAIFKIYPDI